MEIDYIVICGIGLISGGFLLFCASIIMYSFTKRKWYDEKTVPEDLFVSFGMMASAGILVSTAGIAVLAAI